MTFKLAIIGAGKIAEVAYDYFSSDSDYEIVCFAVERPHLTIDQLFGLPVIPTDLLLQKFPPEKTSVFVALGYTQLNRLRKRLKDEFKQMGYRLASFLSSKSTVSDSAHVGEHTFILENNVIQPFVRIGDNVMIWSGNHIGHHSHVEDDVFISSHVVISGNCRVGESSFIGVNCTISNDVEIAKDNWIGPGTLITKSTEPGQLFTTDDSCLSRVSTYRFFKVRT